MVQTVDTISWFIHILIDSNKRNEALVEFSGNPLRCCFNKVSTGQRKITWGRILGGVAVLPRMMCHLRGSPVPSWGE